MATRCPFVKLWGYCGSCEYAVREGFKDCISVDEMRSRARKRERDMKFVKKSADVSNADAMAFPEEDGPLLERFPAVMEHLTAETWDDGSCRQVSTLLVFREDGRWKVCLHDREGERSAWANGTSVVACLSSIEAGIASGTVEWRRSSGSGRKRK